MKVDSLTRNIAIATTSFPKFVCVHLSLPHHPYFFDSNGNETPVDSLTDQFTMNKKAYIEYLQYSNNKLTALIDFIKKHSSRPAVIMLLADHGFRQFVENVDKKYHFMTMNAVYFPDSNYAAFYDGMSNVNQFRVTLNTIFGQQLPLLKDSTIFLTE